MTTVQRVLVVSRHPYPVATTLRRNLTQLVSWGVTVDVVCLTPGLRWAAPVADQPGLRLYGIPSRTHRNHALWYPLHYAMFFLWALVVVSLLSLLRRYDVIEVDNTPDFLVFTTVLAHFRRTRIVLFALELMPELTAARLRLDSHALPVRLATSMERAAIAWVDHVIAVSELCRRILVGRGLASDKVTVVPNSHPVADLGPAQPTQPPFLVIQTTLIERYGVHVAIQALARLASECPDLTLRILGQGESEPMLIELAKRLGLEDRVNFSHGYLPWRPMMDQVRQATLGMPSVLRSRRCCRAGRAGAATAGRPSGRPAAGGFSPRRDGWFSLGVGVEPLSTSARAGTNDPLGALMLIHGSGLRGLPSRR